MPNSVSGFACDLAEWTLQMIIESELDVVNTAILHFFYKACPERRISGRNKMPWWNHELKVLRQRANRTFHRVFKSGLELSKTGNLTVRYAGPSRKNSGRESWELFCSRVEGIDEASRIKKILWQSGNASQTRRPMDHQLTGSVSTPAGDAFPG